MFVSRNLSHNWLNVICCNCDFVYGPTVLQLQLKADLEFPDKSGSGQISSIGYLNPISGRKSVHPYSMKLNRVLWEHKHCVCAPIADMFVLLQLT